MICLNTRFAPNTSLIVLNMKSVYLKRPRNTALKPLLKNEWVGSGESVLWARSRAGEARRSEPLTAITGPDKGLAECRHGAAFSNGSKSPLMQNHLFEAALGIGKPWYVRGVAFDAARKVLT